MNLVRVYPVIPAFRARCLACGAEHDSRDLCADLDGIAFRAYYCHRCAAERGSYVTEPKPNAREA